MKGDLDKDQHMQEQSKDDEEVESNDDDDEEDDNRETAIRVSVYVCFYIPSSALIFDISYFLNRQSNR